MNYKDFEKAMIQPVMDIISDLAIYNYSISNQGEGCLYTMYKKYNCLIRIGFLDSTYNPDLLKEDSEWIVIETRTGREREEKLLKLTLEELGISPCNQKSDYAYSKRLVSYLNTLGWPAGNLSNMNI